MQSSTYLPKNQNNLSWDCFEALEKELENTKDFIELHKRNYHVASEKYQSIILQACAEIESLYRLICGKMLEVTTDISAYILAITDHCKDFFNTEIHMPLHDEVLKPWHLCVEGKDPTFWTAYHAIKHEGAAEKATLEHAIHSLAGLFSLLLAWD